MKALSITIAIATLIALPANAQQIGGPNTGVGANVTLTPATPDRDTRNRIGCRLGLVNPKVCASLNRNRVLRPGSNR
ncbi:MAG TPA: hypothetical protein PK264_24365 [Hyphomicrobiaceae bacterium]|nr:hypothetical protein [Hyphomicrobiaceae bacterium]